MSILRKGRNPKVRKPEQIRWKVWNELIKIAKWYPDPKAFRGRAILLGEKYGYSEGDLIAAGVIEGRTAANYPPPSMFQMNTGQMSQQEFITEQTIVEAARDGKAELQAAVNKIVSKCIIVTKAKQSAQQTEKPEQGKDEGGKPQGETK
ncbi:MAG: hypothetical protein ACYC92_03770 [Candidatus Acidiferrales bacterium]